MRPPAATNTRGKKTAGKRCPGASAIMRLRWTAFETSDGRISPPFDTPAKESMGALDLGCILDQGGHELDPLHREPGAPRRQYDWRDAVRSQRHRQVARDAQGDFAVQRESHTLPIVFAGTADPIVAGEGAGGTAA